MIAVQTLVSDVSLLPVSDSGVILQPVQSLGNTHLRLFIHSFSRFLSFCSICLPLSPCLGLTACSGWTQFDLGLCWHCMSWVRQWLCECVLCVFVGILLRWQCCCIGCGVVSDHGDPWSAHHYRVVTAIVCCLVIAVIYWWSYMWWHYYGYSASAIIMMLMIIHVMNNIQWLISCVLCKLVLLLVFFGLFSVGWPTGFPAFSSTSFGSWPGGLCLPGTGPLLLSCLCHQR